MLCSTLFLLALVLTPATAGAEVQQRQSESITPEYEEGVFVIEYDIDRAAPRLQPTEPSIEETVDAVFASIFDSVVTDEVAEPPLEDDALIAPSEDAARPLSDVDADATFIRIAPEEGQTTEQFIAELKTDPAVVSIEPSIIRRATVEPDDNDYGLQWFHDGHDGSISSPSGWGIQTGSSDVVVAILDSGVDTDHGDLAGNIWINIDEIAGNGIDDDGNGYIDDVNGYDFIDVDGDPNPAPDGNDDNGDGSTDSGVTHGTHVAGLVGAVGNNASGITGVAWDVALMGVRVLDDEGAGTDASIAGGIRYAADNGADIINLSLGGFGSSTILESAVEYAQSKGVLIVAAVGNNGININASPFYPACYSGVIGVGSIGKDASASSFSNYGSDCTDITAPGESIYSTLYTDDPTHGFTLNFGYLSGTSMASPIVAGGAALALAENPTLSDDQLSQFVLSMTTDNGLSNSYGVGSLNIALLNQSILLDDVQAYTSSSLDIEVAEETVYTASRPYFTWSKTEEDVQGYYVYFGTNRSANPFTDGSFQTEAVFQPEALTGNEESYYIRVQALAADDSLSNILTFEYLLDNVLPTPKKVTPKRKAHGVRVRWNRIDDDENVQKYKVYRRVKGTRNTRLVATVNGSVRQYTDKSVRDDTAYQYRVKAIDDLGNESRSKWKTIRFYPREFAVVVPGEGGGPFVRVYNYNSRLYEHSWFAYDPGMTAGLHVATGNLNASRRDEIVLAPGEGAAPEVRVYTPSGTLLSSFMAYEESFRGGVQVAVGRFTAGSRDTIAVMSGPGRTPEVRIYSMDGELEKSFSVLDGQFTGGGTIAALNWNGAGRDEVVVGAGPGGGPLVTVHKTSDGSRQAAFMAYADGHRGGVAVSGIHKRGEADVIATVPMQGASHVQRYTRADNGGVARIGSFFTYDDYSEGGNIEGADVQQVGADWIAIGTAGGRAGEVRFYTNAGKHLRFALRPYGSFSGPVRVAGGWLR